MSAKCAASWPSSTGPRTERMRGLLDVDWLETMGEPWEAALLEFLEKNPAEANELGKIYLAKLKALQHKSSAPPRRNA